jgi:hypothetical protein
MNGDCDEDCANGDAESEISHAARWSVGRTDAAGTQTTLCDDDRERKHGELAVR